MRERVQRNGMIDIWRFIFALLIMGHHMYHLDIGESYLFQSAWIYVEFFFMLSGYFTAKHFLQGGGYNQCPEKDGAKEAVLYTLNKMKTIIPYTTIFILMEYIIRNLNYDWKSLRGFLGGFEDSIFELLLLSSSGVVNARLAPVWYLSAMFLVLPIFCYLIQTKEKLTVYILSWSIPVIYYGKMGVVPRAPWPHDMLRAFSCMMLGVVVYDLSEWIRKFKINRLTRICLTVIEAGCFISTVILTGRNSGRMKLVLILLITGIIVMLSEQSYSSNLHGKISDFLGEISLVIYLDHWVIGSLIAAYIPNMPAMQKVISYYTGSIVCAVLTIYMVKKSKKCIKKIFRSDLWNHYNV